MKSTMVESILVSYQLLTKTHQIYNLSFVCLRFVCSSLYFRYTVVLSRSCHGAAGCSGIRASASAGLLCKLIVVCTYHLVSITLLSLYLKWMSICCSPSIVMSSTSLVSTPSLLTIPPFYEPGAPPPTLPILIAQTEVGNIERPEKKLLTQEELGIGPPRKNITDQFTPHPKATPRSLAPSLLTIPPFYESGIPPPTLPILIAHTEIDNIERPNKLLAQEELGTGCASKSASNSTHRFNPYPKKHSQSLTPKHRDATSESESDRASESDSDSAASDDYLIPKPDGEAGRPGRGGYSLEQTLRWEHKKYSKVKV
jgi:hypothetical protein